MLQEKELKELMSAKTLKARRLRTAVALAALVCVVAIGFIAWTTFSKGQQERPSSKNLVAVRRGSIDLRITSTGTIRPVYQVKLSPKYTGLLTRLYVEQGDQVRKGQVIAEMDDSNLVGQVRATAAALEVARANYSKAMHGNRPQEVRDSQAQLSRAQHIAKAAELAVLRSTADLRAAEAQVTRDKTNAERLTKLASEGAVSDQQRLDAFTQAEVSKANLVRAQQELKQTQANAEQAKAELDSAREKLSMIKEGFRREDVEAAHHSMMQAEGQYTFLKSQLNDTKIRAPFDGVVTQKYADIGAIVTPTTASTTNSATSSSIISLAGALEMVAAVSETDIDDIKPGQVVEIIATAFPDKVFHGHVTRVAPEAIINQNVTTFEVHSSIDDDAQKILMSGMNVNVNFIAGKKNDVLLIPTVSIVAKKGKVGCFVPDKSGNPEFRQITIGTTSDTEAIVVNGLKDNDKVFVGLTKQQLLEQGYDDKNISTSGSGKRPDIPRGLRNKL